MVKGFDAEQMRKFKAAKRMAIGNVKVTRTGLFGVKISGGRRGSSPVVVNIQGNLQEIVAARNRIYKKSRR